MQNEIKRLNYYVIIQNKIITEFSACARTFNQSDLNMAKHYLHSASRLDALIAINYHSEQHVKWSKCIPIAVTRWNVTSKRQTRYKLSFAEVRQLGTGKAQTTHSEGLKWKWNRPPRKPIKSSAYFVCNNNRGATLLIIIFKFRYAEQFTRII